MQLSSLISCIPASKIQGNPELLIQGVTSCSKNVSPGDLFIARRGEKHDGGDYIAEALEKGCVAIATSFFRPAFKNVTQWIHPSIDACEGTIAAYFYQYPSDHLLTVGVTGTNGKTTISYIIKHLLDHFLGPSGLIGTVECILGEERLKSERTTPEAAQNHSLFDRMLKKGCRSVVMEVSSHALEQRRVEQIDFDTAVFSNLTPEHLDYHGSMENYCHAKKRLFDSLGYEKRKKQNLKWAVVNGDCEWTEKILENCEASILTYGIQSDVALKASHLSFEAEGTRAIVSYQNNSLPFYWPLSGRFNVYNCLAAMGVLLAHGITLESMIEPMQQLPKVPGRMQFILNPLNLKIYIDYAHTDDALLNVLLTLRGISERGKIFVVFGCGGERDRLKRSKMAAVCSTYADLSILTSDNPRSEDPLSICEEMVKGFKEGDFYFIELDRRKAIEKAIKRATSEDILLIAGKGHETYQILKNERLHFDDAAVALSICEEIFAGKNNESIK